MRLLAAFWNAFRRTAGFEGGIAVASSDVGVEPDYQGKTCNEWLVLLTDGSAAVRADAVLALAEIGSAAIPALVELLRNETAEVRTFAILALGRIGLDSPAVLPALTASLQDENAEVRLFTVMNLGRMGPKAKPAIPALTKLLSVEDEQLRTTVAKALERIK